MQQVWLSKNGNKECLVFLSGWGTDSTPFFSIPNEGLDVLMLYDYRELGPLPMDSLSGYSKLHLLAWSMGVWVAGQLLESLQTVFSSRTAIGGTLDPVHLEKGIPPESYNAIESSLTSSILENFYRSMFTEDNQEAYFLAHSPKRSLAEIHAELRAFKQHYLEQGTATDIFTSKLITSRDRVFPLRNQIRAWGKQNSHVLKLPHFPFYSFTGWRAVITGFS